MAKIAVNCAHAGTELPRPRELACGPGWAVCDVVCEAGPKSRPFDEQHTWTTVAVVVSGSFQYRSSTGSAAMTPGSLLLGNAGDGFRCAHEHAAGDRCLSFSFEPGFLERVVKIPGAGGPRFPVPRIPPVRAAASLAARASAFLAGARSLPAEELSVQAAGQAVEMARGMDWRCAAPGAAVLARVTRVIRMMEHEPEAPQDLAALARIARLSPHHFLRVFESVTGTTPHQYVLRTKLRRAAVRLRTGNDRILDVALDCGFGDVSNFNRSFRSEFGVSPRRYRTELI
ncbi:MAG: helix-turn-helix transcriptional regulator [Bryobacterales bacterium]|nr:helix-turn-helix transcriptional regulator [Bryobacterales bacterium]